APTPIATRSSKFMRDHATPSNSTFAKALDDAMTSHMATDKGTPTAKSDPAEGTTLAVVHHNWSAPTTPQRSVAAVLLYVPPQTNPEDDQRHKARMRMMGRSPPTKRKLDTTAPSPGHSSASRNLFNTTSPRKAVAATAKSGAKSHNSGTPSLLSSSTANDSPINNTRRGSSEALASAEIVCVSHARSNSSRVHTYRRSSQELPKRVKSTPTTPVKDTSSIATQAPVDDSMSHTPVRDSLPRTRRQSSHHVKHTPTSSTKVSSTISGLARAERYSPTKAKGEDVNALRRIRQTQQTDTTPPATPHVAVQQQSPITSRSDVLESARAHNGKPAPLNNDNDSTPRSERLSDVDKNAPDAHEDSILQSGTAESHADRDINGANNDRGVAVAEADEVAKPVPRKSTRNTTLRAASEGRNALHVVSDENKTLPETPARQTGLTRSERLFASVRGVQQAPPTRTMPNLASPAKDSHTRTPNPTSTPLLPDIRTPIREHEPTHDRTDTSIPSETAINATSTTAHASSHTSGVQLAEVQSLFTPRQINRRLPPAYELLSKMQSALDLALRHRKGLKENLTFARAQTWIHQSLHKTFTEKHLMQMMAVWPEMYHLQRELSQKVSELRTATTYREKFMLLIDADLSHTTPEGKVLHTSIKTIQTRQTQFRLMLLKRTLDLHREYVIAKGFTAEYDDEILKSWHPGFDLNSVPEIEEAAIPQPPVQQKYVSAAAVLGKAGQMSDVVRLALEKAAANRRKRENARNVWAGSADNSVSTDKRALHADTADAMEGEGSSADCRQAGALGKEGSQKNKNRKPRSGVASILGDVLRTKPGVETSSDTPSHAHATFRTKPCAHTQATSEDKAHSELQAHAQLHGRVRADGSVYTRDVVLGSADTVKTGTTARKGMSDTVMAALARAKKERQALKVQCNTNQSPARPRGARSSESERKIQTESHLSGDTVVAPAQQTTRTIQGADSGTKIGTAKPQLARVRRKQLIPDNLLARVKAKGEMKARQQMFGLSQARSDELALVERLPSMALLLHSLYDVGQGQNSAGASRTVLALDVVAEKMQATYRPRIPIDKMYASVRLLLKLCPPGWISEFRTDNGCFLKLNKQMSVSSVKSELERHRETAVAERESARVLVTGGAIDLEEAKVQASRIRQTAAVKNRMMRNKLL
ncbi:hypothetical protein SARC_10379, partial [Sphaeroforma arctica JP610]